ncbi:MAG TPA: YadA C-terminal domain-containing protein [Acinetobacter parvus]|uniref:YadA C-terminal domain-containing protein n=1 Tax=Acinetobacter parvus TaxID=134533 RepID=UPI002C47C2E5|nr:YadA C-terminal domain-containing protein [Acinetobacter parvus]HRM15955.1 YadA C-terminal domain-containing protein [Acinetobacter parvus]
MKLHLKKSSIALAVAAASGVTFAAPVTTTTLTAATPTVTSVAGDITLNVNPAPNNDSQKSVTTTVGEGFQSIVDNTANNTADATKNQATYVKTTNKNSSATGVVTEKQNYKTAGKATVNAGGQVTGFAADPATKTADGAVAQTFAADDVTKKLDANTQSFEVMNEDVTYVAADEKASTHSDSLKISDLTTKKKLGADGKQVGDQTIRTGTVAFEDSNSNVVYKTEIKNGKLTSKNANGILNNTDTNRSNHQVTEAYQTNAAGDVIATKLSADKKSLLGQSSVNTDKFAETTKTVNYDEVSAKQQTYDETQSWENTQEYLDGYVGGNKGTSEEHNTTYNQAALGTSNALDYSNSDKSSSETKSRTFAKTKNAAGEEIYATTADGKLIVNTETVETNTTESSESAYQPTRYTADDAKRGITKGDAYNQHILSNGIPTAWGNTDVQKSTDKGSSSTVVTHKQDNNFQTWEKSTWDNSAVYARNQQENIEVDRDILESSTWDNKKLSKIAGVSVVKEAQDSDFKIGTVAVDVNGNKFDVNDVRTWKDETGKERYYVVIDQDANGQDIRSEVTFKNGKPLETKAAELQTVKTEVGSIKRTDKVTMGAEVAYQKNDKTTWDNKETSKDGNTVYNAYKGSDETNVKVFSVGKNALHREAVETISRETVDTEFETINVGGTDQVIFKDGKPVVLSVDSNKLASSVTDRLFQDGQDKANEQIKTSSYEGNRKNAAGVVQGTWVGHDNSTIVDYAAGKELARTIVEDQATELTSKAGTTNVGFNYDGTAKANIDQNTLRNNGTVGAGLAVKNAATANIVVDTKLDTSNKRDTKTYQDGGVKALESTTATTNVSTLTYADGTTSTLKEAADNQESTVTLFNKGKADKYREAVKTTQAETTGKTYKTDADGDIILANGKPVEQGTSSDKQTVKTTENLYQIGQERFSDSVVVTDTSEKTANVDGSGRDLTAKATNEGIEYRAGQKDGKESEVNNTTSSELKVTNTDKTGYTYKVNGKESIVNNATEMHLLATRDVESVVKSEWTESLAASGKNAVSITRGNEVVNRTDESRTGTVYGSETVTAATGTTTVAKKAVDVIDKFGTFESSTLSRTETKVAADKSSTSNTATRVDSVNGIVVSATKTQTDAAGKATTTESKTTIDANSVTTNHVVAERITLQGGKDLQGEITRIDSRVNQLNSRVDDVQKTAYRGIAIALAAQQAVPNIGPGQVAVFGGVGHYEGETAGSIGVVTSFTDRISASGAFGFASGNEFGGRVGVAYVFGGK